MYSLIVILGLVCVVSAIAMSKKEYDDRKRMARDAFGNSVIIVYEGCDIKNGTVYRYPIRSVLYSCGRKPKLSRIRVDITAPGDDKSLSRDAALFFISGEDFCIKRRKQKEIWIKDTKGNVYLLSSEKTANGKIPECFRELTLREQSYEHKGDSMHLHFGDRILMGNTLFEYNRSEVHNE